MVAFCILLAYCCKKNCHQLRIQNPYMPATLGHSGMYFSFSSANLERNQIQQSFLDLEEEQNSLLEGADNSNSTSQDVGLPTKRYSIM